MLQGNVENATGIHSIRHDAPLPDLDSKSKKVLYKSHSMSELYVTPEPNRFLQNSNHKDSVSTEAATLAMKELFTNIASEVSRTTTRSAEPSPLKFIIFKGDKGIPNRTAALTEIQQIAGIAGDILPIEFNQEMRENAIKEIYKKTCCQPEIFTIQGTSVKPVSSENIAHGHLALPIAKSKHTSTKEEHTKIYGHKPDEKLDYDKMKELPKIQMINLDSNEEFKEHLKNYKLLIEKKLSAQLNWAGINCLSDAGHKRIILALYNENDAELYFPLNKDGSATVVKQRESGMMEGLYRWVANRWVGDQLKKMK